jgi:predicted nucleic acid-binding protein
LIVIDASVMVAYLINEADDDVPVELAELIATEDVLVPPHWTAEIGNALVTNLKRQRISPERLTRMLGELSKLPISSAPNAPEEEFAATITFALANDLTFYDAAYVKLAIDSQATLATLDDAMRRAAQRNNLALVPR